MLSIKKKPTYSPQMTQALANVVRDAMCAMRGLINSLTCLGEVIENIRTFALPFEDQPYTFVMKYEYDSWNRIQAMTYPDGEVVRYGYNFGGMLEAVTGNKHGVSYRYIDSICYNKFELKELVEYGNGTWASYDYDSLLRLSHLRSVCADGTMQDIAYDYDSINTLE